MFVSIDRFFQSYKLFQLSIFDYKRSSQIDSDTASAVAVTNYLNKLKLHMLQYTIILCIGLSLQESITSAKKNKLILNLELIVMFTFDTLHEVVCNFDLIDTKLYDAFSVTFIPLQFISRLILRHKWLVYVINIKCQKSGFRRNHYTVVN